MEATTDSVKTDTFAEQLAAVSTAFLQGKLIDASGSAAALFIQARNAGARAAIADAATIGAQIERRRARHDEGLRYIAAALEASIAECDPARESRACTEHAHILSGMGCSSEAIDASYKALYLAEKCGEPDTLAAASDALSSALWDLGHWEEAHESYRRVQACAIASGSVEWLAKSHGGLAGMEMEMAARDGYDHSRDRLLRAGDHAAEYHRLSALRGDVRGMWCGLEGRALALLRLGDRPAARRIMASLLDASDPFDLALTLGNLAEIELLDGDAASAVRNALKGLAITEASGQTRAEMLCCEILYKAYRALGDLNSALDMHIRYHSTYVRLASQTARQHAAALAVKLQTHQAVAAAEFERARASTMERMSMEDGLTAISNRRYLDIRLEKALQGMPNAAGFGLALLDLDHFKRVNDECSHLAGDAVLRRVADILKANLRPSDVPARYGGEEFVLILSGLDAKAARQVCERVRAAVAAEDWSAIDPRIELTVSVGMTHTSEFEARPTALTLLALADRRLYRAKTEGRNRVVVDGGMTPVG